MEEKVSILKVWFEFSDIKQFNDYLRTKILVLVHSGENIRQIVTWQKEVMNVEREILTYNADREKYIKKGIICSESNAEKENYEGQLEAFIEQRNIQKHRYTKPSDLFSASLPGPISLNDIRTISEIIEDIRNGFVSVSDEVESPDIDTFSDEQYQLFCYLDKGYNRDDNAKPTKYSNIFRFMKNDCQVAFSQKAYLLFIKNHRNTTFPKIIRESYKYLDHIQPLLVRLRSNFDKRNSKGTEMNKNEQFDVES